MKLRTIISIASVFLFSAFLRSEAAERVALVFGNRDYKHVAALNNPVNDATDVCVALEKNGYEVTKKIDATARDMGRALSEWATRVHGAESAIFYFAGHGIEVDGKNYLLPIDAQLEKQGDLKFEALSLEEVTTALRAAQVKLKIIVLDCCRNNPLPSRGWMSGRSLGGGLAEVDKDSLPSGTLLVFSGAPGKTVPDGSDRNSPFTSAFVSQLKTPGLSVSSVFSGVAKSVNSGQEPWVVFDGSGRSFAAFSDYAMTLGMKVATVSPPAPAKPPMINSVPTEPKPEPLPEAPWESIPGFKQRLGNYWDTGREQIEELAVNYTNGLDSRLDRAVGAGDLELVKAWREEKQRVEALRKSLAEPALPARESISLPELSELPEGSPEEVVVLRRNWTIEHEKIGADLTGKLSQSLKALEMQLTRARDIEKAEAMKAFRGSLAVEVSSAIEKSATPPAEGPSGPGTLSTITKDKPFVNSIGMKFVPVPITGGPTDSRKSRKTVLFSIWETRVADFETFLEKSGGREWLKSDFPQGDDHPAIKVSWDDAVAFCEWLTEKERELGEISESERYRLPTDHEWSCAVGIGNKEDADAQPIDKNKGITDIFPWGRKWPPQKGAGNFYGEETIPNPSLHNPGQAPISNYNDGYDRTAPVGSFAPNDHGLYDLDGNVMEWCEDWEDSTKKEQRVLRGNSWLAGIRNNMMSSFRGSREPYVRFDVNGFRCVLSD